MPGGKPDFSDSLRGAVRIHFARGLDRFDQPSQTLIGPLAWMQDFKRIFIEDRSRVERRTKN